MNKRILISSLTGLILGLMFSFSAAETSVQFNHTAANATATTKTTEATKDEQLKIDNLTASQAEILQDNISALRMQVMDNQQQNINWWLTAIALMGAIVPYLFYKQSEERMLNQFRTLLDQAKEHSKQTQISANQAQEYSEKTQTLANQAETHSEKAQTLAAQAKESASNAQAHLDEIQSFHSQAQESTNEIAKLSEQMKKYSSQAQDQESKQQKESIEAARDLAEHSDIPLIEQLRAQAILLSDKADQSKNYRDHLQAFRGWKNVLKEDSLDEQASFNAGLQACYLHQKGYREQQIHWFPEIEQYHRQALAIQPDMYEAAYNWGKALSDEAQALTAQGDPATALEKWRDAGEQYRQALAIQPDMHEAAHNWLTCLSHEYHALKDNQPAEAQAKLQQARDLVNDFLSKNPQHKEYLAYNHACLYALEDNASEAVKQLRLAKDKVSSLGKKHIETDSDFDNIRLTPEFQAWFKEAFPESSAES